MKRSTLELINNSSLGELKEMSYAIAERQRILRERYQLIKALSSK